MTPCVPQSLLDRVSSWHVLKRWERRELGQELRRLGLSYGEITRIVPVHKGTLSEWCRQIDLTGEQRERLRTLRPNLATRMAVGRRHHERAQARQNAIRVAARVEVSFLSTDPDWIAGVVAYWAEGSKRAKPELRFSNSDPGLVALFIRWARSYLSLGEDPFDAQLHLHSGQDEEERKVFWSSATGIPLHRFRRSYFKPEGTGHRKNVLYNGTLSVRVRSSSVMFHRVMGWIEGLEHERAASSTG